MSLPSRCAKTGSVSLSPPAAMRPVEALSLGGPAKAPETPANPFSLVDLHARKVRYLRVSVTDRCNYRCTYCMPDEGIDVVPRADLLDFAEIERLVRLFVDLGVTKVRITGGEPLVRRGIVDLVGRLAQVPGLQDLAMTTNGHLLADLAQPLKDAGLRRLNVSLDTLDPQRFSQATRRGELGAVLRGLETARQAGFQNTKLNAVMLRGLNDREVVDLCDFASDNGLILRYIEYMPIGVDAFWGPETFLPVAEVRSLLSAAWEVVPDPDHRHPGGGPAVYWVGRRRDQPDRTVQLGFISAVTENFCRLCNRVRLSPTGTLRECLSTGGVLSLRDLMRSGTDDATLRQAIGDALLGKVDGHRFEQAVRTVESMAAIGG